GGQGSLNVGAGSKYLEQGASDLAGVLAGAQNVGNTRTSTSLTTGKIVTGTDLSKSNINITDNGAVKAATDLAGNVVNTQATGFEDALKTISTLAQGGTDILASLQNSNNTNLATLMADQQQQQAQTNQGVSNLVSGVLGNLQQDMVTAQAGVTATFQKTLMYVGLGLVAVLGLMVWHRK
ncbi:MAG: hypothetical protein KGJ60_13895, partial [Verrucomicrobiota bacterium]|nr:hypothetical protein [Verrucomicrobiota bacterium]